jgi:hypothetical protein
MEGRDMLGKSDTTFDTIRACIPGNILDESGKVFYSGRAAFSSPAQLYILGLNPGGAPGAHEQETLRSHTEWVAQEAPVSWSAYRDESWEGRPPGCYGMQPRMLHMFRSAGLGPGAVPASNLVFVRSRNQANLGSRLVSLADFCWSFHEAVIDMLEPKVILCLGQDAGNYLRGKLRANRAVSVFTETNGRRWTSATFASDDGHIVVVATHPSRANWTTAAADPTGLIREALRTGGNGLSPSACPSLRDRG